jgi:SAM-dependent methyltransferase
MFQALQDKTQIEVAREELKKRNISAITPEWKRKLARFRICTGVQLGDHIKSWDVLKTVQFIEQNVAKDAAILDHGAYASEVPAILHKMGYKDIYGIDFDTNIVNMPYADSIQYAVGNFYEPPYEAGKFSAITSISVIEHGFDAEKLFSSVANLLKSGGYFVCSFDYWPQGVDTSQERLFGMSWTIFSDDEVINFLKVAEKYGLTLSQSTDIKANRVQSQKAPIHYLNRDYTFGWMVLRKA